MKLFPRVCYHPTGYAFVENDVDPDAAFGVHIGEAVRDLMLLGLSVAGYEARYAQTSDMDPGVEKVLAVADDIISRTNFDNIFCGPRKGRGEVPESTYEGVMAAARALISHPSTKNFFNKRGA